MTFTRIAFAASLLVALGACGPTPTVVATRNLERPTDMAFFCIEAAYTNGAAMAPQVSAQPMAKCHPLFAADPPLNENGGPRLRGTFSAVANSARGELAFIDLDVGRLFDLDPANPGYNMVPVGTLPEAVAASPDGCVVATANHGSCDLTVVDTSRLFADRFKGKATSGQGGITQMSTTVVPTDPTQRLQVAPRELVFLPNASPASQEALAGSTAFACPANAAAVQPWRALATFPDCDLVALLEMPSGHILSWAQAGANGETKADSGVLSCPNVCGTAKDGSALAQPLPLQTTALALTPDGKRVFVAGEHDSFLRIIDVVGDKLVPKDSVPLHENAGGVFRLRLSAQPFREQRATVGDTVVTTQGTFVGEKGVFLYAFAGDGSVRVLKVDPLSKPTGLVECDVNAQATAVTDEPNCFLMPDTLPDGGPAWRRPLARGPGLRIPTNSNSEVPEALPRDIAFAQIGPVTISTTNTDRFVNGAFGFLLASNGQVYLLNIDPAPRTTELATAPPDAYNKTLPAPNTFRNGDVGNVVQTRGGPPRVTQSPVLDLGEQGVTFPKRGSFLGTGEGPNVEPFLAMKSSSGRNGDEDLNPLAFYDASGLGTPTYVAFSPDTFAVSPSSWSIVWENSLVGTSRIAGTILGASGSGGQVATLNDQGADFCGANVEIGDAVRITGCMRDAECGPPGTATCLVSVPGAPGICLGKKYAEDPRLAGRCGRLFSSRRRYEVTRAAGKQLDLKLKADEISRPDILGCPFDPNPEGEEGKMDCSLRSRPGQVAPDSGFRCRVTVAGQPARCIHPCESDGDCRAGTVCEPVGAPFSSSGSVCVEAPPPIAGCLSDAVHYVVEAANSYVVTSTGLPPVHNFQEVDGVCTEDPHRNPLFSNRIRMSAPRCSPVLFQDKVDAQSLFAPIGKPRPDSHPVSDQVSPHGSNPCLLVLPKSPTAILNPKDDRTVKAFFENTQLRFVMNGLDQYPGDAFAIHFDVTGGFLPDRVETPSDVVISLGTTIVTSPMRTPESVSVGSAASPTYYWFPYLFVIDQGRASATGSRGQILRINPRYQLNPGTARFDSATNLSTYPIQ